MLCTLDRRLYHSSVLTCCRDHGIQVVTDVYLLSPSRGT